MNYMFFKSLTYPIFKKKKHLGVQRVLSRHGYYSKRLHSNTSAQNREGGWETGGTAHLTESATHGMG